MHSCVLSDPTCFSFRNAVGLLCVFSHMMSVLRPVQFLDYLASQLYGEAHETVPCGPSAPSSFLQWLGGRPCLRGLLPTMQLPGSLQPWAPRACCWGDLLMTHAHWLGPHLSHTRDLLVGIEDGMMICFIRQLRK